MNFYRLNTRYRSTQSVAGIGPTNPPTRFVRAIAMLGCAAIGAAGGTGIMHPVAAVELNSVSAANMQRSNRETPTVTAIRRASPAVVNLHGHKTVHQTVSSVGGASPDVARQVNGMGTGVVIDTRGYVITNFHVVEDVFEINVTLQDGSTTTADLVVSDPANDLALVKLRGPGPFQTIPRGQSVDLMVGESVIAIGNAFGYVHTSTVGIVSALHRDIPVNETQSYRDLIQTSAGINPGNSGGPLLNIDGEIIGLNVAVRVGAQQIAFAIPIDQVLETTTEMINRHNERRFLIGLEGTSEQAGGLRIVDLSKGGSAQRGGLQTGDRIMKVDEDAINTQLQFALAVLDADPGQKLRMEFRRGEETYETFVATVPATSTSSDPVADVAWQVIGVAVRPAGDAFTRRMNSQLQTNYRGGLQITDVRPGSAADQQGLRSGDVLLGIHSWQTSSLGDLAEILQQPEIRQGPNAKFYIVRRDQTLYGHMQLAAQPAATRR